MKTETSNFNEALAASGSPRARCIRKTSRLLQLGCRLLLVLLLIAAVSVSVPSIQALLAGREAYFPGVLMHLYWGAVLWLLERMFHVFSRHDGVFDRRCARYLRWLGGLFLVGTGIQLLSLIPGATTTNASVLLVALPGIMGRALLGACVLMLGWVVEEGCVLREEQALTV